MFDFINKVDEVIWPLARDSSAADLSASISSE